MGGQVALSQSPMAYTVMGKILVEGDSPSGTIVLIRNSEQERIAIDKEGTFSTHLKWNHIYYFYFQKTGFVTKIIEFNTTLPNETQKTKIEPYNLLVKLFKTFDDVDTVFFLNPVAKIQFDSALNDFDYDIDYSMKVKYKLNEMSRLSKEQTVKSIPNRSLNVNSNKKSEIGKTIKPSVNASVKKPVADNHSTNQFQLPPLKESYAQGKTVEVFEYEWKTVTRIIIQEHDLRRVFSKVKHNWGPTFYFKDNSPLSYISIPKQVFEWETK